MMEYWDIFWLVFTLAAAFRAGYCFGARREKKIWTRPSMDGLVQYHNGVPYVVNKLGVPGYAPEDL
jgi:hypothetical protein